MSNITIIIVIIDYTCTLKYFHIYYLFLKTTLKTKNEKLLTLSKNKTDKINYWKQELLSKLLPFANIKVAKCTGLFTCPTYQQEYQSIYTCFAIDSKPEFLEPDFIWIHISSRNVNWEIQRSYLAYTWPTILSCIILNYNHV